MNNRCETCGIELPPNTTRAGLPSTTRKNCETCGKARTKVKQRIRDDKTKLINHYGTLKKELKVIEELKQLIKEGEDINARTKELLETGHGYWEKYNLSKYYRSSPKKPKTSD